MVVISMNPKGLFSEIGEGGLKKKTEILIVAHKNSVGCICWYVRQV